LNDYSKRCEDNYFSINSSFNGLFFKIKDINSMSGLPIGRRSQSTLGTDCRKYVTNVRNS
jgi:hypothetical protein